MSIAGPVPSAPTNRLAMLTDYIAPEERLVACPNQDMVYGAGSMDKRAIQSVIRWQNLTVRLRVATGLVSRKPR
jgi:hypothetical protein